ncbi:surface antigen-like protein [Neolewinella xylanilytica]|uniref:Surface antigen-like protein n=1 Tax=Neolewinella xylanilytica TaxID=1514080 RepID=A0A2S6I2W0_9BACT|nr:BamA/TamA family outer membrane protein [Neolewinella xylanilytica]PPK85505.1 surface antigen-like protein [Neolewinella xylanilytica]
MRLLLLFIFFITPFLVKAGPGDSVYIDEVLLIGHKKTRPRVIFREMTFGRGQQIAREELSLEIDRSYNNLMNTGLFASVDIAYDTASAEMGSTVILVNMRESWYIYPVPEFELADRNFNVWWNEQERSLDRVNIGGKLTHYNVTGQRDRLKVGFTTGYTRSMEASYGFPYLNKAGSIGMSVGFSYQRRREQNYLTRNNRQEFYSDPNTFVYRRSSAQVSVSYRRKIYLSHSFGIGWQESQIADTIAELLNPEFYGDGRQSQRYFRISYDMSNDRRDIRNYPWKGTLLRAGISKDGLGIYGERDGLEVHADYQKFIPFWKHYSFNYALAGKYSLIRTQQPFLENRAIGFGSNGLIGYQFYVVDGLDMMIWRLGLRRELFKTKLDLGKLVFIDAFRYVPIRMAVSLQFNQGFANAPFVDDSNRLNNNLLTGFGAGLDVILYYDMVGGVQYNRNHLGEDGVYLNLNMSF